jgi:DNA polymerase elongation subunit (family B)
MKLLASERNAAHLADLIPQIIRLTRSFLDDLDAERVLIQDLVCQTKLSKELHEYKGNSTSAKAARQLAMDGKHLRVGQGVKFIYTHGQKTNILAWDLQFEPNYSLVDKERYRELLLRTVNQILQPLGMEENDLISLVYDKLKQLRLNLWSSEEFWDENEIEEKLSWADVLFSQIDVQW